MMQFSQRGGFSNTEKFLKSCNSKKYRKVLDRYARDGVTALSAATPVRTGKTASSWSYEITEGDSYVSIVWKNSNVKSGVNVAIILQYGHGTKNGGYVNGIDYINPAMRKTFQDLADAAWKEVTAV